MELNFIEAKSEHLGAITDIHNSNVLDPKKINDYGFLLAKTNEEEINQGLNNNSSHYFIAIDDSAEVLGILNLERPKISQDFLDNLIWQDASCREQILSNRHLYIKIIATKINHRGKGIAQFMYRSMYAIFPDSCWSAFIVTKPVYNYRSMLFHKKQGFQPVATFQADVFLDLKNYQSTLVFKNA
jgi:L-amino acid N-acyltransferase YncA